MTSEEDLRAARLRYAQRTVAALRALADAFSRTDWERVTKLFRGPDVDDRQCWLRALDWCLAWN